MPPGGAPSARRPLFVAESMAANHFTSAIFSIPGFVLAYIIPDFMHTCCRGIAGYRSGNIMWELFKALGRSFKRWKGACAQLINMMVVMSRELGLDPPFADLTVYMIRPSASKKPRMTLKVAECRFF